MPGHRAELITGGLVLLVAGGFLAWALGGPSALGGARYQLHARFPDVDGIERGTDIRISGVRVGRVADVVLDPAQNYLADVVLDLPAEIVLASDSAAIIESDGLLGGAYIALQPGGAPDDLRPGDEIEDVQGAVSLISLMMKFVDSKSAGDES
ncbi:outer membrane lipid asymmetry maintenance protein MlaD [Paracoccus jiaweipingae]|uniref:outer membrane lipid asymmetry maintenance protein MlaD n=1 Tax=unclassified Paracoccus (in: a-proteobacteria) TaxID=2688777 RepID=UPI0037975179